MTTPLSFVALIEKANEHCAEAEALLRDPGDARLRVDQVALIHATLAEAYARMASALVVNVTSAAHVAEQSRPT